MSRLALLDRLRGLAVVVMIEVHVVNALLATNLRGSAFFRAVDAVNGLVAPSFLFCAGMSLAITLARPFAEPALWGRTLAGHLRRAGMLFVLGYVLHASALLSRAWGTFFQADILQTIALSLAFTASAAVLVKTRERFRVAMLVVALAAFVGAPLVRAMHFARVPASVLPYLTDRVETQFPLLPWTGFVFAGALVGSLAADGDDRDAWRKRLQIVATFALVGAVTAWGASALLPPHDPWTAGPAFMLARLAIVLALASVLTTARDAGRAESIVVLLGRHSLLVYFAHIAIVYGRHPASMRSLVGPTLAWGPCLGSWLAVTAAMFGLAVAWERRKGWIAAVSPGAPRGPGGPPK